MYRLATVLVAAVMVLLPLIYVSIIVLVGYLLRLHILNAPAVFMWRVVLPRMIVVVAPLVIGGTLILFMIKPLFARSATENLRQSRLNRRTSPRYMRSSARFAASSAPRGRVPSTWIVRSTPRPGFVGDCRASIGDLALVVGLPLIEGLGTRQFASRVLAHEFGHFAQGVGMRLTYVVHSINRWFGRVVYERDRWDRSLEEWADSGSMILSLMLHLARGFVWASRKVLWLLMMRSDTGSVACYSGKGSSTPTSTRSG